jgi:hypothetical protein
MAIVKEYRVDENGEVTINDVELNFEPPIPTKKIISTLEEYTLDLEYRLSLLEMGVK